MVNEFLFLIVLFSLTRKNKKELFLILIIIIALKN